MIYEADNYKAIDSEISMEALQDIFIHQDNKKINCHYYEKKDFISKFSKEKWSFIYALKH